MLKKILAVAMVLAAPVLLYATMSAPVPAKVDAAAAIQLPGEVPVPEGEFRRVLRSVSVDQLWDMGLKAGIYDGSPKVLENKQWYEDNFYATLASRKIWKEGTSPDTHERGGPITWDIVPIPQDPPPPCDQPQPTGYDAESCRIVNALFTDVEDAAKQAKWRDAVRRGRDVWFKGSFGNQDLNDIHLSRTVGKENMWYPWMDTRERKHRFTKWGMINDPDCVEGNADSFWLDICQDPKSTGVLGYRKYWADPIYDDAGNVVFDPKTSPYEEGELQAMKRFKIGHTCVQCHVGFDPTDPPKDPNEPKWENLMGLIGNQHINQPHAAFLQGTPDEHFAKHVVGSARPGTVDTSLNPNDFKHNPGTQNNITDFINRRFVEHEMKHPITGEIKKGLTQQVLKGGEDSVGDHLALIRVYVNIGMCTEECWVPNFPVPGTLELLQPDEATQKPFRIKQCYQDCEAWNHADAKMTDLAAFLITGGPTYLLDAVDVDGTPGSAYVDLEKVPAGRKVYAENCASCHSSKLAPENIRADKDALAEFYEGHVFGNERFWQYEFDEATRNDPAWQEKYLVNGQPRQFAEKGVLGQDWLGSDEAIPFNVIGTNMCRALHDNHNEGHIWEEFASETYRQRPSPGSVPREVNRLFPLVGGMEFGDPVPIEGGPGYLRAISLLSSWAISPFLHNNAIGELTYLEDGAIDYTVKGRITQYEMAMQELLMSDDPSVTPHRQPKITRLTDTIRITPREDGQGFIKIKVPEGTPVTNIASQNPHDAIFMTCNDLVENKGHQFGVDLSAADKEALTEFLKLM